MRKKAALVALAASIALSTAIAAPKKENPARSPAKILAAKSAPAPASAGLPPRLYDFKGVALETSLEDFRKMLHPDGTSSATMCTGEKPAGQYATEPVDVMIFDDIEKRAGVIKCVWVAVGAKYDFENGRTAGLSLAATDYGTIDYSFSFIRDPNDSVMRLFQFNGTANRAIFGDVVEAMTGKFGTPHVEKGSVQNGVGNTFDQTTVTWANPLSSMTIQDRWSKIDNMGILMTDERLYRAIKAARDAKKAATPNAI